MSHSVFRTLAVTAALAAATAAAAAQDAGGRWQPRVEIAWNRYYDYDEILGLVDQLHAAWPGYVQVETIGESWEGRPMKVMTLTNHATGPHDAKPAMWVDGNVHGNEVQGAEAALYLAWWLLEHQEDNPRARALLDTRTFYILPSQNPDGRDHWFHAANTASSSRSGVKPYDSDRDGQVDEDGYDDLDGDGEITQMRKRVPLGEGTHRQDPDDPRVLVPVRGEQLGDWLMLGSEGLDNDGDGRINEDGPGGYDMNRNWPTDWQPNHIQGGAGDYPFSYPETRAIGDFLLAHPNVAAVQSFHNAGGMLLRGPGSSDVAAYPRADEAVYDEIGQEGEFMLPFYRYMVIWRDLYTVHGGFVNWTYEGLGIFSFTNELWAGAQLTGGAAAPDARRGSTQMQFNDSVLLGDAYSDWKPFEHPLYGSVEIGGFKRQAGRVAPSFMIEEMLHRNAMFCARHAEEIAELAFEEPVVERLGGDVWRVTATLRNSRTMPSRSALAAEKHIGMPDRLTLAGPGVKVLAGGLQRDRWRPERLELAEREPARLLLERGVPGHGRVTASWIVQGSGAFTLGYQAEKSADVTAAGKLR
ncbi:MAG TPA: M14 family metallopeptidase [Planctomycetota bacterium]